VQIALDPIRENRPGWGEIETIRALDGASIRATSGMMATAGEDYSTLESIARTGGIRPDSTWGTNLRAAQANARLARRMGIGLVTFHAGFIPHEAGEERTRMLRRLRTLTDVFDDCGIRIALETGQETAETLLAALAELERPHVGVNFDPANMILYGMGEPVVAVARLAPRVAQVHIKDALPTAKAGTWGREMPAGMGAVDWTGFFGTLGEMGIACPLIIECEAGHAKFENAVRARDLVMEQLGRAGGKT
jgi:sugar phosphate isomerase/epimerase